MANTNLTISAITNEALMVLENELTFTKQINREYDDQFAKSGAKIGDTINIRKPARYVGRRGPKLQLENFTETSTPLTLDTQYGCDIEFTSKELTLDIDLFADRVLKPAIATVANAIDFDGMAQFRNVYNSVGVAGTTPASQSTYLDAGVKLDNEAAPRDGNRSVVFNPIAQSTLVNNLSTLFNNQTKIADQYDSGTMGRALGFKFSMDQNVNVHQVGPQGGTPLVNAATTANGATSIVTDGWTAAAALRLRRGDVFTIAGVFAVNPQNRQSTGQLRQFVVTADVSSDGAGNATIPVSPAITYSGQYQTVSVMPADNAALTVLGAANVVSPQNLAFHRDAFTFGTADLIMPNGVDMARRVRSDRLNISMRMVRAYDINNDAFPMRLDILGGWATIRPELATRIYG
jgi:hypothetical protein